MRFLPVLLLLSIAIPFVANGERCVQSVSGAQNATDDDYARHVPFSFSGKISAGGLFNTMLFQDSTGSTLITFELPGRDPPVPGSVLQIRGNLRLNEYGDRRLYVNGYSLDRVEAPDKPADVTIATLLNKGSVPSYICTTGTVVEVIPDEIDANFTHLILFSEGVSISVAVHRSERSYDSLRRLTSAKIKIAGIYCSPSYWRRFASPCICYPSRIETLTSAPEDPFALESLRRPKLYRSSESPFGTLKKAQGTVLARWKDHAFLLRSNDGLLLRVRPSGSLPPPEFGQAVVAAGLIDSNGSNLLMHNAIWKSGDFAAQPIEPPVDIDAKEMFLDKHGERAIQYDFYGRAVRLTGTVLTVQTSDNVGSQLLVESGKFTVPIDISGCPKAAADVSVGCKVSVAGVCLIDFENWRQGAPFPRIRGIQLVVREPNDIRILSRPSPLTAGRLMFVIGMLVLVIATILVWNRILAILIDRKSRELFKSQIAKVESELRIEERTRLAAELHDYTAQNLTAVSYQIAAAKSAHVVNSADTGECLDIADRMLHSCRTELRRCLWDLRNDALDDPDFAAAIRKTVASVAQGATIAIRFPAKRSKITDTTAHAILSIVRELVSNAVRHGHASRIRIAGEIRSNAIRFSVQDNGTGFDPNGRLEQAEGHFGLSGITERLKRLNGDIQIHSTPSQGTRVIVSIRAFDPPRKQQHEPHSHPHRR